MRVNPALLIYVMLAFASALVVLIASLRVPAIRRERLRRVAFGLMASGFALFGAEWICAGTEPFIGWLLIASSTFGTVMTYILERRATRADLP
jgi:uncharacterized membrane protein